MKKFSILLLAFIVFVNCSTSYAALNSWVGSKDIINDATTLAELQAKGLQIIEEQSFPLELEHWGKVRFVSMSRGLNVSFYLVGNNGEILYSFPRFSRWYDRCERVRAVAFSDVNRDGLTDIIITVNCSSITGKQFPVAGIFFQKGKEFVTDPILNEEINDANKNETVDMVLGFMKEKEHETLADMQSRGLRLIEDQSFSVELENWGKVRFVSILEKKQRYISFYLIGDNGEVLYSFPQHFGNGWAFFKVRAVSFVDANHDGLTDVIIIAEYATGHGVYGARPFPVADVYFQKGKEFINNQKLAEQLNFDAHMNQNIDMVLEFMKGRTPLLD